MKKSILGMGNMGRIGETMMKFGAGSSSNDGCLRMKH
jgi:hypothetical protein